jgi:hypothetical protein
MRPRTVWSVFGFWLLILVRLAAQDAPSSVVPASSLFDAQRLKTGTFVYRDMDHGKEVGRGTITIQGPINSRNYAFSNHATFSESFSGYRSQQWEAVVTSGFQPVSATLSFGEGPNAAPVFDLKYSSRHVTGFTITRKGPDKGAKIFVDAALPTDIVDQRIDWAAVLASDHQTGRQYEFHVYDPGIGISQVTALIGPVEQVQVPAGTFAARRITYRIEKATGTEEYQIFSTLEPLHMMLREEFPNGVVSELLESSASASRP